MVSFMTLKVYHRIAISMIFKKRGEFSRAEQSYQFKTS